MNNTKSFGSNNKLTHNQLNLSKDKFKALEARLTSQIINLENLELKTPNNTPVKGVPITPNDSPNNNTLTSENMQNLQKSLISSPLKSNVQEASTNVKRSLTPTSASHVLGNTNKRRKRTSKNLVQNPPNLTEFSENFINRDPNIVDYNPQLGRHGNLANHQHGSITDLVNINNLSKEKSPKNLDKTPILVESPSGKNLVKNLNNTNKGSRKITDYWNGEPNIFRPNMKCESGCGNSMLGFRSIDDSFQNHIIKPDPNSSKSSSNRYNIPESSSTSLINHNKQNSYNSTFYESNNLRPILKHQPSQTELTVNTINKLIQQNTEMEDLRQNLEEQRILVLRQREIMQKYDVEKKKILNALKKALIEQAKTERRHARDKVGRNRIRLGYLTRSQNFGGMNNMHSSNSSADLWTNGSWLENLEIQKQRIGEEKDDIERQKKALQKRKPARRDNKENNNVNNVNNQSNNSISGALTMSSSYQNGSNSDDSKDAIFAKPRDPNGPLTTWEHYELDEVLKIRSAANKREEADWNIEMERFERERSLHIRELKRIANEDNSKGGFSEVYKGFDLHQQLDVAIKIHHLNREWSDQKKLDYSRHANRECEIQMRIDHPRIVKLFDTFELDVNTFCTIMEFCPGQDLDHYLKEHKMLSEKEARSIIMQVISALKYLNHMEKPVIHYDLKPGNILLCQNTLGNIKITDFGLSKQLDSMASPHDGIDLTSQGAGTYWYLPPECFVRGVDGKPPRIDNKVDVWAVGVIFYQCLYGKKPFGHNMSQEAILKSNTILRATDVSFPLNPKLSDQCKDFIKCCLAYNKESRSDVFQLSSHPYLQPAVRKSVANRARKEAQQKENRPDQQTPPPASSMVQE